MDLLTADRLAADMFTEDRLAGHRLAEDRLIAKGIMSGENNERT